MSVQAMAWVIERAQNVPTSAAMTLMGLANHADRDGTASFPSVSVLARYARKSERAVQVDLRNLESRGLIRRGDQRRAAHIDSRYRPVVYDLALPRGEVDVTPADPGVKLSASRGEADGHPGVKQASPKPSFNREEEPERCYRSVDDFPSEAAFEDHRLECGKLHRVQA